MFIRRRLCDLFIRNVDLPLDIIREQSAEM